MKTNESWNLLRLRASPKAQKLFPKSLKKSLFCFSESETQDMKLLAVCFNRSLLRVFVCKRLNGVVSLGRQLSSPSPPSYLHTASNQPTHLDLHTALCICAVYCFLIQLAVS